MALKRIIWLSLFLWLGLTITGSLDADAKPIPRVSWGIYQILWSPGQFERELAQQLDQLGGTPKYVLFFRDLEPKRGFPLNVVQICDRKKLTPVISFEPAPWGAPKTHDGLSAISSGRYDQYFRQWGRDAARWGKTVIFRFGFEMNGNWFSWGQQPKQFKSAWRRIHRLFKETGASNVKWLFSPNVAPKDADGRQNPLTYYPGDHVVDYVGVDGYNFGDHYDRWHRWHSFKKIFEPTLAKLSQLNKPLFIAEIGCAADDRKALWIRDFLSRVAIDRRITAFIYYNYYPKARGYPNWRLDSDSATLQIFRKWADDHDGVSDLDR